MPLESIHSPLESGKSLAPSVRPVTVRVRAPAGMLTPMPLDTKCVDARRFDPSKMQKINLFETPRCFCDVYCLEPGQAQRPHRHEAADKIYAVLEGEVLVRVGEESASLKVGTAVLAPAGIDHGIENQGPARAAVLVFMAPRP